MQHPRGFEQIAFEVEGLVGQDSGLIAVLKDPASKILGLITRLALAIGDPVKHESAAAATLATVVWTGRRSVIVKGVKYLLLAVEGVK